MIIRFIVLAAFQVLLIGCRRTPEQIDISQINKSRFDDPDTLIALEFKQQTYRFHCARSDVQNLRDTWGDFMLFEKRWNGRDLAYHKLDTVDITGDGKADICESRIAVTKGSWVLAQHRIYSDGKLIWNDTLRIDDNLRTGNDALDDSISTFMKPDLNFFFALERYNEFISDSNISVSSRTDQKIIYLTLLESYNNPAYWESYLKHFKGRYIFNLSMGEYETYIWDARTKKFIQCYVP
jgi:hypothetical protein